MHPMDMNPCALESPRPELSHAQGFISKSLTVASECSTENPSFSEIRIFFTKFYLIFLHKKVHISDYDNLFVSFEPFCIYLPLCCCFSQRFRSNSDRSLFETLCVGKLRPQTLSRTEIRIYWILFPSVYAHIRTVLRSGGMLFIVITPGRYLTENV